MREIVRLSLTVSLGAILPEENRQWHLLIVYFNLQPKLRTSGVVTILPHTPS